jgi:hypothetical protein
MLLEHIGEAVESGDFVRAQALLAQLPHPPATPQEAARIKESLQRALQTVRIQRAHDAARLGQLVRASAYRPRNPESQSTWTLDG